jgi:ParB family chromosome partitioning protein
MTQRDRKNSLKALFSGDIMPPVAEAEKEGRAPETKSAEPPAAPAAAEAAPARAASGAVKAMGLSLSSIAREAEEARTLREALSQGETIIALDPEKIEASFVTDRLTDEERDDPDFLALVESIREGGQQVPILVRPMGGDAERYQVAYGHRRLKAARRLGQPVRAIVKALSDDELVLAQGKENAERRNLSFIERAMFAHALSERGFDRKLIADALGTVKSELSRLLQVAEAIPARITRAIGPAPKTGRPRWMAFAEIFTSGKGAEIEKAVDEMAGERFLTADSDTRFQLLFQRLSQPKGQEPARKGEAELAASGGAVFARLSRRGRGVTIRFAEEADEEFIAALGEQLARAYGEWTAGRKGKAKRDGG